MNNSDVAGANVRGKQASKQAIKVDSIVKKLELVHNGIMSRNQKKEKR